MQLGLGFRDPWVHVEPGIRLSSSHAATKVLVLIVFDEPWIAKDQVALHAVAPDGDSP